ncbi:hypothetical protein RCZ04_11790 [Capnocytophaga sp. HP1101]
MAINISIIGGGNVAYHLTKALYQLPEVHLQQLYNRSEFSPEFNDFQVEKTHALTALHPADVCIIAVKDEAIAEVSASLPFEGQLVVHTSGNSPMEVLSPKNRRGVFYPLQSFSKSTQVNFSNIPFCLEAEHTSDISNILRPLAEKLSTKVYQLSSYQRSVLHLSAVFVNNFTNHLVAISQRICEAHAVPFEILEPLLKNTFEKLQTMPALEAQTGPARRGDTQTIANHLALLAGYEREIYDIITKSIINTYGKKEL